MKNDIKFIIPDKFLVDLEFKEKLQPLGICELNNLIVVDVDRSFDFEQMTDDDLIDYYNNFGKMNRRDKALEVGKANFELYDMDYSYSYNNGKLHLKNKLFYKSPDDLFGGTSKFSVDLYAVLKIPDKSTDAVRAIEYKLTLNIAGKAIDFSHYMIADIINTCSIIDFTNGRCNEEMPDNVRIIMDESMTPKVTNDTSDKDDLYFKYKLYNKPIWRLRKDLY